MAVRARITWRTPANGGRAALPTGVGSPPYAAVVRFVDADACRLPEVAWSFAVEKVEDESDGFVWIAKVRFLMENAPHEDLLRFRRFELYEGAKCVATGEILGEYDSA